MKNLQGEGEGEEKRGRRGRGERERGWRREKRGNENLSPAC